MSKVISTKNVEGSRHGNRSIFLIAGSAILFCCLFLLRQIVVFPQEEGIFRTQGEKKYYIDSETGEPVTGQKKIGNFYYMFDTETGEMIKGFYQHTDETNPKGGPKICYYDENGHMIYGQKKIDGYYYNFAGGTGAMLTGFVEIPSQEKTCYYDEEGRMLYGEQVIDGTTYWFAEGTGALLPGPPEEKE